MWAPGPARRDELGGSPDVLAVQPPGDGVTPRPDAFAQVVRALAGHPRPGEVVQVYPGIGLFVRVAAAHNLQQFPGPEHRAWWLRKWCHDQESSGHHDHT